MATGGRRVDPSRKEGRQTGRPPYTPSPAVAVQDDSNNEILLPCEFCNGQFPIESIDQHEEDCSNHHSLSDKPNTSCVSSESQQTSKSRLDDNTDGDVPAIKSDQHDLLSSSPKTNGNQHVPKSRWIRLDDTNESDDENITSANPEQQKRKQRAANSEVQLSTSSSSGHKTEDDSDDDILLPCEFCSKQFPIASLERHQEDCSNSQQPVNPNTASNNHESTKNLATGLADLPLSSSSTQSNSSGNSLRTLNTAHASEDFPFPSSRSILQTNSPSNITPPSTNTYSSQPNTADVQQSQDNLVTDLSQLSIGNHQSRQGTMIAAYVRCRYCHVKLLEYSLKHHEVICPANPRNRQTANHTPLQCNQPTNRHMATHPQNNVAVTPTIAAVNVDQTANQLAFTGSNRFSGATSTNVRSINMVGGINPVGIGTATTPYSNSTAYPSGKLTYVECQRCNVKLPLENLQLHERVCPGRQQPVQTTYQQIQRPAVVKQESSSFNIVPPPNTLPKSDVKQSQVICPANPRNRQTANDTPLQCNQPTNRHMNNVAVTPTSAAVNQTANQLAFTGSDRFSCAASTNTNVLSTMVGGINPVGIGTATTLYSNSTAYPSGRLTYVECQHCNVKLPLENLQLHERVCPGRQIIQPVQTTYQQTQRPAVVKQESSSFNIVPLHMNFSSVPPPNTLPKADVQQSQDNLVTDLSQLSIGNHQSQQGTMIAAYVRCRYCHVKLFDCSMKYHEVICPQNRKLTSACRYCHVKLLEWSTKYHEVICPANPQNRQTANHTPLQCNQATNHHMNNVAVTPTSAAVNVDQTVSQLAFTGSNRFSGATSTNVLSTNMAGAINPVGIGTAATPYSNSTAYPSANICPGRQVIQPVQTTCAVQPIQCPAVIKQESPSYSTVSPPSCAQISGPGLTLQFVTWNINKGTVRRGQSTAGFADMRRLLINYFNEKFPFSFYCFQEIDTQPFITGCSYSEQIGGKRLHEAGVACPTPPIFKNCDISLQCPPARGAGKCRYDDVANQRFYGKIVQIQDRANRAVYRFILVSYHGKYSGMTEQNRKMEISSFFRHMCEIADIHRMTVVIGGDFNLAVDHWKQEVETTYNGRVMVAVKYEKGPRRLGRDIIDTFAVVYPSTGISCSHCVLGVPIGIDLSGALQQYQISSDPVHAQKIFDLMDHDPVVVNITLSAAQ